VVERDRQTHHGEPRTAGRKGAPEPCGQQGGKEPPHLLLNRAHRDEQRGRIRPRRRSRGSPTWPPRPRTRPKRWGAAPGRPTSHGARHGRPARRGPPTAQPPLRSRGAPRRLGFERSQGKESQGQFAIRSQFTRERHRCKRLPHASS
jgi:hypothetical protein